MYATVRGEWRRQHTSIANEYMPPPTIVADREIFLGPFEHTMLYMSI
jgi:hypothetical protein